MGGTAERLRQRARRRADWLSEAAARLGRDPDVAAAWVFGAEGRGEADELSDLRVLVAIADEVADHRLSSIERSTFEEFGDVLSVDEADEFAPACGRAFVVAYPAPVEQLTVGWWFQRVGAAQPGNDARVLVDKAGLPTADPQRATAAMLPREDEVGEASGAPRRMAKRTDRLQHRLAWTWATAPTVAKWLARGWVDQADAELDRMAAVVDEATAFLNRPVQERSTEADPVRPLSRLRGVLVELSQLHGALAAAGLAVPSTDVAYGWLELAEDLEAERWTPNSPKRAP